MIFNLIMWYEGEDDNSEDYDDEWLVGIWWSSSYGG
jgi:hypothetical protein